MSKERRQITPVIQQDEPLHTKYRPKDFDEVVGQDATVKSLRAALKSNTRPHTYLFTGGPGTGKTTLARIMASKVGVSAANLVEVDAATSGGVDTMRDLMAPLRYQGFGESPNKAVILDECHMLSKNAWASLLKITEEAPPHVFFFFCTTDAGKVPEATRTRCAAYNLRPASFDDLMDLLEMVDAAERLETPDRILQEVAHAADGSPRSALVMLALVRGIDDPKEAARLLERPLDDAEVIDLCRMLVKGDLRWSDAAQTVKGLEQPAETVRVIITAYLTSCLMGAKGDKEAMRLLDLLEAFSSPYNASDKNAPLLLSLGRAIFG